MENHEKLETDAAKVVTVSAVITYIGSFGTYQKIADGIISFVCFFVSFQTFIMYFATLPPSWRCVSDSLSCYGNETKRSDDMARCDIPRDQWYFMEQKTFSMITWYDTPCEQQWILGTFSSTYFVGFAIGAIVLGWLADVYGRRPVFILSVVMISSFGVLTPVMPDMYYVLACRFCAGFFHPGAMVQGVIIMAELVGSAHRSLATLIPFLFFPGGWCVLALKAYFLQDWRVLCFVCTVPYFIVFLCCCSFIPESPAWLVEKGRTREATDVLRKMAKYNKTNLPFGFTLSPISDAESTNDEEPGLSTEKIVVSTLIQCALWCSTTFVFFGLNFAANKLPGNLYLNFFLLSFIEVPTVALAIIFSNKFGRKVTSLLPILLGGVSSISLAFIPYDSRFDVLKVLVGIIGKFFVCIPFQSLYVWSAELIPTRYRAQGVGLMDCVSRLSAACAPLLLSVASIPSWLFFAVIGIPALLATVLGLWLPETKVKELITTEETGLVNNPDADADDRFHILTYKESIRWLTPPLR